MSSDAPRHTNRLIDEKSPYLLQHAHNPVDWFPWGAEALEKARAEDKPILVSIGYATCHWCHVMERESFEDEDTAAFLNERFVAIKVDREERPDVDKIYMDALHALGEGGGWPLNMFLTSEAVPFTGGTYFPPEPRYGRPSFRQVLERIDKLWRDGRDKIDLTAEQLKEFLLRDEAAEVADEVELTREPEDGLVTLAKRTYDSLNGGFQTQPQNKFPPSMQLMHLLRIHHRLSDERVVELVEHTLERMKAGGIYDQIGGGLCRYSTDYHWKVPHFEKMLYDNALWISALTEAKQALEDPRFEAWARDAIAYVQRDMKVEGRAFASAEDADSEGHEGKFYVWSEAELLEVLGDELGPIAKARWGVSAKGNWEGSNILVEARPIKQVAADFGLSEADCEASLAEARRRLFERREGRIRPLRDDKVLVSWNALMISAFARAGMAFDDRALIDEAAAAARFIFEEMRDSEGRLLRRYREGEARYRAYLVDHAQLAVACLDLFEATEELDWVTRARGLMDEVEARFAGAAGAFYDTAEDAERLLTRTAEGYDGVEPSGNSAAAWAFARLYALTGREADRQQAEAIVRRFWPQLTRISWGYAYLLRSLDALVSGSAEVILVGEDGDEAFEAMRRELREGFHPGIQPIVARPAQLEAWREVLPTLEGREALEGRATAWVCRAMTCGLPAHDLAALRDQLAP